MRTSKGFLVLGARLAPPGVKIKQAIFPNCRFPEISVTSHGPAGCCDNSNTFAAISASSECCRPAASIRGRTQMAGGMLLRPSARSMSAARNVEFRYGCDRDSNREWKKNSAQTAGMAEHCDYDGLDRLPSCDLGTLEGTETNFTGIPGSARSAPTQLAGSPGSG
jgi:hypothetical protein